MPEPVEAWWQRRQFSRGTSVPYALGTYRADWQRYPVLIRQYHPDLNAGIALTQVPPAAEVYLQWQCDVGHVFVATPEEQRARPGRQRRRSNWCPECARGAVPKVPKPAGPLPPPARKRRATPVCRRTPALAPGEAFVSECAPVPASAVEAELRQGLAERLEFEPGLTAVRTARPFFDHLEVWPDVLLSELRVAIEFDSTGRHGLEHVGRREEVDVRKDRLLRQAGWEVIRVRTGRLLPLGPHDLVAGGVSKRLYSRILDELRLIRGDLIVDCYLR